MPVRVKSRIANFNKAVQPLRPRVDRVEKNLHQLVVNERENFVARIENQQFQSFIQKPLSPRYLAHKRRRGLDLRTMIATGFYIRHIRVSRHKEGHVTRWKIGIDPTAQTRRENGKKTPLWLVAMVQELGSFAAHVPARPHWRPYRHVFKAAARKWLFRTNRGHP